MPKPWQAQREKSLAKRLARPKSWCKASSRTCKRAKARVPYLVTSAKNFAPYWYYFVAWLMVCLRFYTSSAQLSSKLCYVQELTSCHWVGTGDSFTDFGQRVSAQKRNLIRYEAGRKHVVLKGRYEHEGHQNHEQKQCHNVVNILETGVVEFACNPKEKMLLSAPATMKPSLVVNRFSAWHTLFMDSGTTE